MAKRGCQMCTNGWDYYYSHLPCAFCRADDLRAVEAAKMRERVESKRRELADLERRLAALGAA